MWIPRWWLCKPDAISPFPPAIRPRRASDFGAFRLVAARKKSDGRGSSQAPDHQFSLLARARALDKLKADQRAIGANLAVLVSTALPDSLVEFGRVDGAWVAGPRAWPALAVALREQLIEVAFAHAAAEGKS